MFFTDNDRRLMLDIWGALWRIERQNHRIERTIMADAALLQKLQDAATQETTVEQSAIALLGTISQELKDALANNDTAAIQGVIDTLNSNAGTLATSVTANTPAVPAPPAPPVVPPAAPADPNAPPV